MFCRLRRHLLGLFLSLCWSCSLLILWLLLLRRFGWSWLLLQLLYRGFSLSWWCNLLCRWRCHLLRCCLLRRSLLWAGFLWLRLRCSSCFRLLLGGVYFHLSFCWSWRWLLLSFFLFHGFGRLSGYNLGQCLHSWRCIGLGSWSSSWSWLWC